jgi:kynurenine formamidase
LHLISGTIRTALIPSLDWSHFQPPTPPTRRFTGGRCIAALEPSELTGPGCVIDVSSECAADPDYLLSIADARKWEQKHGKIPTGAIVCMRTGWDAKFADHRAYMGLGDGNEDGYVF